MLVLYRKDCRFLLDAVIPRRDSAAGGLRPRARQPAVPPARDDEFKAERVLAPLARRLAPGGRLLGIHSAGNDRGSRSSSKVWPDEDPFTTWRRELLEALREGARHEAGQFHFNPRPTAGAVPL